MMGKVIRPLRSVDPSQTEYQGLIEVTEEGCCQILKLILNQLLNHLTSGNFRGVILFQVELKVRIIPLESWVWLTRQTVCRKVNL